MPKTNPLRSDAAPLGPAAGDGVEPAAEEADEPYDSVEIYRVRCPRCAQPIALLAEEESLPEHALCATPWNPFGLTVCQGSGLPVTDAELDAGTAQEADAAALLTLPAGLDWRTQPFSHAVGPASITR
ncbi:hypothetical protein JJV70_16195 [Streptomyces sp. JJ66]|uniref:hypothetical protein n=1 Tax=Streptomyces sp. JJ66 TaxID=2803843 RepID=UPI001C577441|nr:hypothetical protein [Streptomyces sp. JJ66]MBW1603617.1 hypothetical protein [Streptomyces sp. JJ66]